MNIPDVFDGKNPYGYGFEQKDDCIALEYVRLMLEVKQRMESGRLYIKFVDGDRKGSIARVSPNYKDYDTPVVDINIINNYDVWNKNIKYRFGGNHYYGICHWDGRKNKVKISVPNRDIVFLLNYDGPTIWEKFDVQSAKKELLKSPNQKDIDGNLLSIGDSVLYINVRYGSGMVLCHGRIKDFKAVVDSKRKEVLTIVEKNDDGELSTINSSHYMIWKKKTPKKVDRQPLVIED